MQTTAEQSTERTADEFGVRMGKLAIALALYPYNAWVLTVLWAWFIAPRFELPSLGIAEAAGLLLTARFVISPGGGRDEMKLFNYVMVSCLIPLIILAIGWVISRFL